MNHAIQNNPSNNNLSLPSKRKRGRPRKDQSANRFAITKVPPGFGGVKEKLPQHGAATNEAHDGIVGHAVTAVVDAAFDAGYLLSVRIGNSIFRGIVFKPGHIAPVTVENDVAPHVQVVRRKDIHVPANNRLGNNTIQNGSPSTNQWIGHGHQATSMTTTTKGKYASPIAPSVFPVGARGTVVPVVLQPANRLHDFTPTPEMTPASSRDVGVNDGVYTVEPLAMLPSVSSYQTPVGQNQELPSQTHVNQQGAQTGAQNLNISSAGATLTNLEEVKQVQSAEALAQNDPHKGGQGSPPPSEIHDCNLGESNMSHGHPSQHVHSLSEQSISVSQPLGRYPTGRMTELLLALQENMMENQVIDAEPPSSTSTVDHDEESGD